MTEEDSHVLEFVIFTNSDSFITEIAHVLEFIIFTNSNFRFVFHLDQDYTDDYESATKPC